MIDLSECGVTSSSFPKSVRVWAELNVVIGVQDQPDHFRQELVAPDGQSERSLFPVPLGDVGSACWLPLIPFEAQSTYDVLYPLERHAINGFRGHAFGGRASVAIDLAIGGQVKVLVEQLSVDSRERESLFVTLSKNVAIPTRLQNWT